MKHIIVSLASIAILWPVLVHGQNYQSTPLSNACKNAQIHDAPADTSLDILATCTIPPLKANDQIRFQADYGGSGAGGNKTFSVYWNTTNAAAGQLVSSVGGGNPADASVQGWVANRNATNSQVWGGKWRTSSASGLGATGTSALDTTVNTYVVMACQKASAGDTCRLNRYLVEVISNGL